MSAENTENNILKMQTYTYIESSGLENLTEEYTEDTLRHKFSSQINLLRQKLDRYTKQINYINDKKRQTDWNSEDQQNSSFAQELLAEEASIENIWKLTQIESNQASYYSNLLQRYGNEFAQLYKVKDSHEKRGFTDKLDFVEVDITDNGDILTQDQYYRMRADINDRLYEIALHVELEDDNTDEPNNIGFNFGVLEFNQPDQPPQTKIQLSFDDETLEQLNETKLKKIFDFCESHGISVSDLQIRRFDGSLAEDLIREKIENILEQAQSEKEAQILAENQKELLQTETRHKELEAELQNIVTANNGQMPEGLSWEKVSSDVVPEKIFNATNNQAPLAHEFANNLQQTTEQISNQTKINTSLENIASQTISKGIAVPASIPADDMQHEIIENTEADIRSSAKKVENKQTEQVSSIVKSELRETPQSEFDAVSSGVNNASTAATTVAQSAQQTTLQQTTPPPETPKISKKKVEEGFEELLTEGWNKVKGLSYFKEHTGWFGTGWTEYIIYDNEDKENRRKDGIRQQDGSVKYTYSFKLFLQVEKDGTLNFTYRTPNKRKLSENYIKDIAGKLKSLGYTHINFPVGVSNEEKGVWRQAMAENGLIPLNMGLDSHKAAKMIDTAKEKLSAEDLANYKYRLGLQMKRYNEQKGKHVSESESNFIDGLINTHDYAAFTSAYSEVYKSKIENILRTNNRDTGAIDKTAAYRTLYKVFLVYKSALENGGSLLNAENLTPEEKQAIRDLGLTGSVKKLNTRQMDKLFDVLYTRQVKEADYDIVDNLIKKSFTDINIRGAKQTPTQSIRDVFNDAFSDCERIDLDLAKLGIDPIKVSKVSNIRLDFERFFRVDKPEYDRRNAARNTGSNSVNANVNTASNAQIIAARANHASAEIKKRKQQAAMAPTEVKTQETAKVGVTQVVAQSKVRSNN